MHSGLVQRSRSVMHSWLVQGTVAGAAADAAQRAFNVQRQRSRGRGCGDSELKPRCTS